MPETLPNSASSTRSRDVIAGVVVFLVALPLCLGVASASGAPALAGLIAGIVGGIIVGFASGSHSSVSGPAAGLTAIVAAQIVSLGSFEAFLVAVFLAGIIQIAFGLVRLGFLAGFFPSSVIKGLLAAIGIILILKQIPHLVGHDPDPEDDFTFAQSDGRNTFSELFDLLDLQFGALLIGISSLVLLMLWNKSKTLKYSLIPAPLVVVIFGILGNELFDALGGVFVIEDSHLVKVPKISSVAELKSNLFFPDFSILSNKAVYLAAITVAVVASLETLLNLEAVDKLDPEKRNSPANRELVAQGIGNMVCGVVGGLPVTSVIVRSSVNLNAGGRSRLSTIVHGILLLFCVLALPSMLNRIPLSCLAAILIVTGFKLASPKLIRSIRKQGWSQVIPFAVTVAAIVLTDLLIGILIGLAVSLGFILRSNLRRPFDRVLEKHVSGDVLHIHLPNQVSFLNRGSLSETLDEVPEGGHVLINAGESDYIDPDILDLIMTFEKELAPARGVKVSLSGFKDEYLIQDRIQFADYTTRQVQEKLTPEAVLQILKEGNERFIKGEQISRDYARQVTASSTGQFPIAAVLSCIDSRAPTELLFDVGLGDLLITRVAGNVPGSKILGSLEYAAKVAKVKLIVVMGHTLCGAVTAAVKFTASGSSAMEETGCMHLDSLIDEIVKATSVDACRQAMQMSDNEQLRFFDEVARLNVLRTLEAILAQSLTIREKVNLGELRVIGCMYDVKTGKVTFAESE